MACFPSHVWLHKGVRGGRAARNTRHRQRKAFYRQTVRSGKVRQTDWPVSSVPADRRRRYKVRTELQSTFESHRQHRFRGHGSRSTAIQHHAIQGLYSGETPVFPGKRRRIQLDRKSTRLNSSHLVNSYAAFCLKKKVLPFGELTWRHFTRCSSLAS